jgi:hypothetical protein
VDLIPWPVDQIPSKKQPQLPAKAIASTKYHTHKKKYYTILEDFNIIRRILTL